MNALLYRLLSFLLGCVVLLACDSSRTNTKAERDATYVEDGDTINPTEGEGEGTSGHKYMETKSADSTKEIEQ